MSVSSIGSAQTYLPPTGSTQRPFQQIKQTFSDLSDALNAGDLQSAQAAFASLQSLQPPGAANAQSPLAADISSLGQALQSGDIKGAQQAFAQLQQDSQSLKGSHHHHRHHGGGAGSPQANLSTDPDSTASTTSTTLGILA